MRALWGGILEEGWPESQIPADNPTVHSSVVWYVERGLQGKGLAKQAAGDTDLLVRYYTSAKEGLKGTPSQSSSATGTSSNLSTSVGFRKEMHGTLVLEEYRASDEALVWKAAAPWSSVDKAKLDTEVDNAVRLLLGKHPVTERNEIKNLFTTEDPDHTDR